MKTKRHMTIKSAFNKGMESGKFPHPENKAKALKSVASEFTAPIVRAYWSGYLCQSLQNK
jgi:hypothetical protein